ncbi:YolD-like family protein [Brevibacillus massiliensis]|uniref:YolD-like family protein n=1 Tax=Brevibacillus massiliensis TaxID=1118054 RepID=UPI0002D49C01|nr:YolD-like family protein [Brevibacillus massiliensis]
MALFVDETTLVKRPEVDEDEQMEYGYIISESEKEGRTITVRWWYPVKAKEKLGEIREVTGVVRKIDTSNRRIRVENMNDSVWIDVAKIVRVSTN